MGFFNSLPIRIPLALLGAFFYSSLTYAITLLLGLSPELALFAVIVVFLFYLASRLLLLFSGVNTFYYSRKKKTRRADLFENTSFSQTAQWVGKFYHYHDIVLFVFLALLSIGFLISLPIDLSGSRPIGYTMRNLLGSFIPLP